MKFAITNRWTGATQLEVEIADELQSQPRYAQLRAAVLAASASGSNLRGSNLRGSNLRDSRNMPPLTPIANIDGAILAAIEGGGRLEMATTNHKCIGPPARLRIERPAPLKREKALDAGTTGRSAINTPGLSRG